MSFSAIIVAAGSGSRAGGAKQWRSLAGKPMVRWSVEAMLAAGAREVMVAHPPGDADRLSEVLSGLPRWRAVEGGESRAASVRLALDALSGEATEPVLVHDAARPFLRGEHVASLLSALQIADGAVPTLPVSDTLKRNGQALATVDRDGLLRAQTPQAFRRDALIKALDAGREPTDDAGAVEAVGGRVVAVAGDPMLFKLTYPEDFAIAERLASGARLNRVGQGFDAHRLGPGDGVWLCGVLIPHDQALIGHSDADVALHALTDAVLGAIGAGDIGQHFPPSDPKWRGAASDQFLLHALSLVGERGGGLINVDVTLICEAPRVGPHREAMRQRLAALCSLPLDRVSVKATTTEKMGFTGRGEGIAAQALAVVETPA